MVGFSIRSLGFRFGTQGAVEGSWFRVKCQCLGCRVRGLVFQV